MTNFKSLLVLLTLLNTFSLFAGVSAHTLWTEINGQSNCLRPVRDANEISFPVRSYESDDVMCNVFGRRPAQSTCAIQAGSSIRLRWQWSNVATYLPDSTNVIDPTHFGACTAYLAPLTNSSSRSSVTPGETRWAKIYEASEIAGDWCTLALNKNGGYMNITIPDGLADGHYVMRTELIALHYPDGAEYFTRCADITITGGSNRTFNAEDMYPIPGHINSTQRGVNWSSWGGDRGKRPSEYPVPGPRVARFVEPPTPTVETTTNATTTTSNNNATPSSGLTFATQTPTSGTLQAAAKNQLPDYESAGFSLHLNTSVWSAVVSMMVVLVAMVSGF
ncbi:hypothetical protein HK102_007567 [Quaeritorhiza haematococci]|nr:hypothetical protein HK102_007567 [Quaeritorhiza haematococci]